MAHIPETPVLLVDSGRKRVVGHLEGGDEGLYLSLDYEPALNVLRGRKIQIKLIYSKGNDDFPKEVTIEGV